jgi:hypothetical protein
LRERVEGEEAEVTGLLGVDFVGGFAVLFGGAFGGEVLGVDFVAVC